MNGFADSADNIRLPRPYWRSDCGRFTVYCADCRDVLPHLTGVDAVVTDPPYNVGINYGPLSDDNLTLAQYDDAIKTLRGLVPRADFIVLLGSKTATLLTWWNNLPTAKLVVVRVGASVNTVLDGMRPQFRAVLSTREANKWWSDLWEDVRFPGEGYFFNEERFDHPCHAPVRLMEKCLVCWTKNTDTILDPFMGSGTTGVACVRLGRRFIGIEIHEPYCKIAVERIERELAQGDFLRDEAVKEPQQEELCGV
jgi:DNA modification methylase